MVSTARSRFDLVIFDCDGVIVDSEAITHRVFGEMLHGLGLQMSAAEMYAEFAGRSLEVCLAVAENPKPDPDVFLFAAKRMGLEPHRTVGARTLRAAVRSDGVKNHLRTLVVPDRAGGARLRSRTSWPSKPHRHVPPVDSMVSCQGSPAPVPATWAHSGTQ